METTRISKLPIIPEEYLCETYEFLNFDNIGSIMTDDERRFINGLLQYYQPDNILEIGVFEGGGTVHLLSLKRKEALLVSIDYDSGNRIGKIVFEKYPDLINDSWHLIVGKDPSEVLDDFNTKFDFVVIDSGHFHPCEALNFISILPFLNDGSIVIVHDTHVKMNRQPDRNESHFAPRLLFSSVCAEKITLKIEPDTYPNIAAFQVTQDTRKYVRNIFDVLMFPWQYFDKHVVESMRVLIRKHYCLELQTIYEMAVNMNIRPRGIDLTDVDDMDKFLTWDQFVALENDTIFYGAGKMCAALVRLCIEKGIEFNYQIWDIAADAIQVLHDKPVMLPDINSNARPGQVMVIMIENSNIANTVRTQFESLGFTVYPACKFSV